MSGESSQGDRVLGRDSEWIWPLGHDILGTPASHPHVVNAAVLGIVVKEP